MSLAQFATPTEARIAAKLVADILAAGCAISVYDGEEFPLVRSTDKTAVLGAMASTDQDTLQVRSPDGARVGSIMLVYGNGCDLISDHTDNAAIDALVKGAGALAETLDR